LSLNFLLHLPIGFFASMKLKMADSAQHHLILLPGLDGSGRLFEPLLSALPPTLSASVVRYPAEQSLSPRVIFPCIREVIPWDRPYVLVAESLAASLALQFAEEQQQNIRAVVLCASFVSNPVPAHSGVGAFQWAASLMGEDKFWLEKEPSPALVRKHLTGEDSPPALVDQAVEVLRSFRPDVLSSRVQSIFNADARRELRDCEKPLLYLQASEDQFVRPGALDEIRGIKPSVKIAVVKGPHLLLQRNPRGAIDAIRAFLNTLPAQ